MEQLRLNLAEASRNYDILIGEGLLGTVGKLLRQYELRDRVVVVTNPTVAGLYLQTVLEALQAADFDAAVIEIPDGESYKSLEQAQRIYDFLVAGKYDRNTIILALGGGVIGDLSGFAAATYMRGVRLVQCPTTLLSQVDSSVGGKVAVNHPQGKNLIGAFYQPNLVVSDVVTLKTLPERELASGMAEVLKHGVIADENYYTLVSADLDQVLQLNSTFMTYVVSGSCRIKADVVQSDEKEQGLRAILNFGHTIGHSLESLTGYQVYTHGEGVFLGMLAGIKLAERIGWLPDDNLGTSLQKTIEVLGAPKLIKDLAARDIYETLFLDKKVKQGKIRWVLPKCLGEVKVTSEVSQDLVMEVLKEMGAK